MKKAKGFTLVELVIVIIIVGILSIVAVPIYRGYTKRAYASEGRALLGSIQTAQKVYFAENGNYYTPGDSAVSTVSNSLFDVDATKNKYFTSFTVKAGGTTWSATTAGIGSASGISVTIEQNASGTPILTEALGSN